VGEKKSIIPDNCHYTDEDETAEYELNTYRAIIKELKINLGKNDLPRFSCACHKSNIAVRLAIKKHSLARRLKDLTKFAARTRSVIRLSRIHIKKKCRLRIENLTRWSSSFMILVSFKKAFETMPHWLVSY
jgi:hypothetical protein